MWTVKRRWSRRRRLITRPIFRRSPHVWGVYFSPKLVTSHSLGALKIRNQTVNWLIGAFAFVSLQIFYLISRDRLTSSFNFQSQFVIDMVCFIINWVNCFVCLRSRVIWPFLSPFLVTSDIEVDSVWKDTSWGLLGMACVQFRAILRDIDVNKNPLTQGSITFLRNILWTLYCRTEKTESIGRKFKVSKKKTPFINK